MMALGLVDDDGVQLAPTILAYVVLVLVIAAACVPKGPSDYGGEGT